MVKVSGITTYLPTCPTHLVQMIDTKINFEGQNFRILEDVTLNILNLLVIDETHTSKHQKENGK